MKVLLASMQYGRGYGQGTERYISMLVAGLNQRGHEAVVLAGDPERRGLPLALGAQMPAAHRVLHYPTRSRLSVLGLAPRRLRPLLEAERPNLVHLVNPGHVGVGLLRAAREAGLPTVVTVVDYWWLCPKHTLLHYSGKVCDGRVPWIECLRCLGAADRRSSVRKLARLPILRDALIPALYFGRAMVGGMSPGEVARWTRRRSFLDAELRAADAVIFLSGGARRRLGAGLDESRCRLIPVGMEPRWFAARREDWDPLPRDPSRLSIGFVGAVAEHKGPHTLLEAVKRLGWTQTRVRLAGRTEEGRYLQRLRGLAQGLNVEFLGVLDSEQIPPLLRSLDVLVVPSLWPENQPQTVLEAQAAGVPVLASDVDGIREVIADPSPSGDQPHPMLFAPGSVGDLARALSQWAANPSNPAPAIPVSTADEMVRRTLEVYLDVQQR